MKNKQIIKTYVIPSKDMESDMHKLDLFLQENPQITAGQYDIIEGTQFFILTIVQQITGIPTTVLQNYLGNWDIKLLTIIDI